MLKILLSIVLLLSALPASAAENTEEATLDHMLGAMLMLGFRGTALSPDDPVLAMLREGRLGGVLLFDKDVSQGGDRNIASTEQLKALTASIRAAAPRPVFIGVDQEGGQVRRLKPQKGFFDLPSAQSLGQGSTHATLETAGQLGKELAELGINLDLAPVVDVDSNPFNPAIGRLGRSFGTAPQTVAQHALAFGQGLAKNGVIPCLKHFPGQGCASEDSHLGLPDISQCWKAETDLAPYAEILASGWPGMIMAGHILHNELDDQPSTFSKKIITGLLRNGLGWQGVVISDDLQMKAVSQGHTLKECIWLALDAGMDIVLLGNNLDWDAELPKKAWDALAELAEEGTLTRERIIQSWERISALHAAYSQQ